MLKTGLRARHKADCTRRMRQAAAQMFRKAGYDAARTGDIAAATNGSAGTLDDCTSTKGDLMWDRVGQMRRQSDHQLAGARPHKGRAVVSIKTIFLAARCGTRQAAMSIPGTGWAVGPVKSIHSGFTRTAARKGLKDIGLHTLCHTASVHLAAGALRRTQIAQLLGHNHSRFPERVFASLSSDHLRATVDGLDHGRFKPVRKVGLKQAHFAMRTWVVELMVGDNGLEPLTSSMRTKPISGKPLIYNEYSALSQGRVLCLPNENRSAQVQ